MAPKTTPTLHRDGTVTFWSVYSQTWRRRVGQVENRELAAMSPEERARVLRHLAR